MSEFSYDKWRKNVRNLVCSTTGTTLSNEDITLVIFAYEQYRVEVIEHQMFEDLKGEYKHWCPEWDFQPIDENSPEFESCLCYTGWLEPNLTKSPK